MSVDVRSKVVAMRRWQKAEVEIFVRQDGVGAEMELDEFLRVVTEEMGGPTFLERMKGILFTRAVLLERLTAAAESVVAEMKRQTVRLV